MIIATHINSEKGKSIIKTSNEFIFQEFTVKKIPVGEIELYYFDDSINDCDIGEWLLKYRPHADEDWIIIAQGNI